MVLPLVSSGVMIVSIQLLSASAECSPADPTRTRVEFSWQLASDGAPAVEAPLVLELSVVPGDFSPGPNRHVIELPANSTLHVFEGGLVPNTVYHWRIGTSPGPERITSGTASFESPACAVGDQIGP